MTESMSSYTGHLPDNQGQGGGDDDEHGEEDTPGLPEEGQEVGGPGHGGLEDQAGLEVTSMFTKSPRGSWSKDTPKSTASDLDQVEVLCDHLAWVMEMAVTAMSASLSTKSLTIPLHLPSASLRPHFPSLGSCSV